jgi:hypothetical protein
MQQDTRNTAAPDSKAGFHPIPSILTFLALRETRKFHPDGFGQVISRLDSFPFLLVDPYKMVGVQKVRFFTVILTQIVGPPLWD